MITQMRSYLRSHAYRVAIWIFVFMVGFGSVPLFLRKTSTSPWAFRINNHDVSEIELRREYDKQRQYISHIRAQYGEYADMILKNIDVKQIAIRSVQQEELLSQLGSRVGLRVDNEYLAEQLHNPRFLLTELGDLVPAYVFNEQGVDQKALFKHLSRKGMNIQDLETKASRMIVQQVMHDMIASISYVPVFEIRGMYNARYRDKKLSYLSLSLDPYVKKEKQKEVTKADLISFYDERKDQYALPEKRSGIIWEFSADKFGVAVSDQRVEEYYTKAKATDEFLEKPAQVQVRAIVLSVEDNALRDALKKQAEEIHARLTQDPSLFEAEARAFSHDTKTKDKGGLLPFITKGEEGYDPLFEKTAFLLKAPGDISGVIETKRGLEILQLVEKKPRVVKSLSAVKDTIKKKLVSRAFKGAFDSEVRLHMGRNQQNTQESLARFAAEKHATERAAKLVVAGPSRELKALFDIKKLNGVTYYQENDRGFIVYLTDIEKRSFPALTTIEQTVKEDFWKFNAKRALKKDLEHIQQLSKNASLEDINKEYQGQAVTSGWIVGNDAELLKKFFPKKSKQDFLMQMENVGAGVLTLNDEGGMIVKLVALGEFNKDDFAQKQKGLRLELARKKERLFAEGFVAYLYRIATIETNEAISLS